MPISRVRRATRWLSTSVEADHRHHQREGADEFHRMAKPTGGIRPVRRTGPGVRRARADRQPRGECGGFDARQAACGLEDRPEQLPRTRLVIALSAEIDAGHGKVIRIESDVLICCLADLLYAERGNDDKEGRDRHLSRDQESPRAPARRGRIAFVVGEQLSDVRTCGMNSGSSPNTSSESSVAAAQTVRTDECRTGTNCTEIVPTFIVELRSIIVARATMNAPAPPRSALSARREPRERASAAIPPTVGYRSDKY